VGFFSEHSVDQVCQLVPPYWLAPSRCLIY